VGPSGRTILGIIIPQPALGFALILHPNDQENARMLSSGIVSIIISLVVVGLLLYLIDIIPMDGTIKQIIRVIVIIAVIIWLLQAFGLIGSLSNLLHPAPIHHIH
jgi:hypothetical protein